MPQQIETISQNEYIVSANGKKTVNEKVGDCRATLATTNWELVKDDREPFAIDVEFQNYKPEDATKYRHRIGRIAVVNTRGEPVYDVYTRYQYDPKIATLMPHERFNVERKDLWISNGAKKSSEVQTNLRAIFKNRLIVGHGMTHDKVAVGDVWTKDHIDNGVQGPLLYDTQHEYGRRKLCDLVEDHLDDKHFDYHNPVDDARAAMLLYLHKHPYEGRDSFRDQALKEEKYEEDFPALGRFG